MLRDYRMRWIVPEDPMQHVQSVTTKAPPRYGPDSGKQAWIDFAMQAIDGNEDAWAMINKQSVVIRELQAEVAELRKRIATRKPKGGRPRLLDEQIDAIRHDIDRGLSARAIGARHGVSATTVSRYAAKRITS